MIKDHEKIKELISSYIDGAVSQDEKQIVEDLLLSDRQWQEYYKELQRLSSTLQDWGDEEVSADMANEIQKTLFDEKLREGAHMKSDTWLKVGGGALVTFAICMIIGIVYLRTYSAKTQQEYMMKSHVYQPQTYEPYYLDTTSEVDSKIGGNDRFRQQMGGELENKDILHKSLPIPEDSPVLMEKGFDLSASYKEVPRSDRPADNRKTRSNAEDLSITPAKEEAQKITAFGGFQESRMGSLAGAPGTGATDANEGRVRGYSGFQEAAVETGAFELMGSIDHGDKRVASDRIANKSKSDTDGAPSRSRLSGESSQRDMGAGQAYNAPTTLPVESAEGRLEYSNELSRDVRESEVSGGYAYRRLYDDEDQAYGGEEEELYFPHPQTYPEEYPRRKYYPEPNTEEYDPIYENPFLTASSSPLSTFSIDVDTAAYSNVRRFLKQGQLPPADAVRIEEMVNYFDYNYPQPDRGEPFSVTSRGSVCPWNPNHLLVQVGLKGNIPAQNKIPPSNLVFLIDVSGSMNRSNKLPLLKQSLKLMVDQLRPDQQVAIVTYSGSARLVLDSTSGTQKHRIHAAIDNLSAGGSTAGEAGLRLAYRIARDHYIRGGNNRVLLATDGDFNVGMKNDYELVELIKSKRKEGVFLSILGFGSGNYKDAKMEKVADNGNGNYHYIDSLEEGRKVLVNELGSTLFAIAKDVKIQVEFNPQHVHAYRLIGYENRLLNRQDFNNDRVDAGEIGAGHTVTALYEIVPAGGPQPMPYDQPGVDRLKYQKARFFKNQEMMTIKLRYKPVNANRSRLIRKVLKRSDITDFMHADLAFASAVAEFGMLLRNSRYKGYANYDRVLERASRTRGSDLDGRRAEFLQMVETAKRLDRRSYPPQYPQPYSGYQPYHTEHVPQLQFK